MPHRKSRNYFDILNDDDPAAIFRIPPPDEKRELRQKLRDAEKSRDFNRQASARQQGTEFAMVTGSA